MSPSRSRPKQRLKLKINKMALPVKKTARNLTLIMLITALIPVLVGGCRIWGLSPKESSDWVRDTLKANKEIYGIDLESNARRFHEVVYGSVRM